jgi:hypothetical protein
MTQNTQANTDFETVDDFDMSTIDAMPQYLNDISGIVRAILSLSRDTNKEDKTDRLIFDFKLTEIVECRKGEPAINDLIRTSYSLALSDKEKAKGATQPGGLRMAKPLIDILRAGLKIESGRLNDIIAEVKDVDVTATVNSRVSKVRQPDGSDKEYTNIDVKRLIVN